MEPWVIVMVVVNKIMMKNIDKPSRILVFGVYVLSSLHFIDEFQKPIPFIENYEGWRFYLALSGLILNLLLIVSAMVFFKRVFIWTWMDDES